MKALSIRQPWAWLIVNGYKDIENRYWPTAVRGQILIHASSGMTRKEYLEAVDWIAARIPDGKNIVKRIPAPSIITRGAVIGVASLVDCVNSSKSPWFVGKYGFVLENGWPLDREVIWKGQLGFFEIDEVKLTGEE